MGKDIFEILDIKSYSIRKFSDRASLVIDPHTEKIINGNIKCLQQISDSILSSSPEHISQIAAEKIIEKIKKNADNKNKSTTWTTRELRIATYFLNKLEDSPDAFYYTISLFYSLWKYTFIDGLTFYVLNSWNTIQESYRNAVCSLILEQLNNYQGNNHKYNLLKLHYRVFEKDGHEYLSDYLISNHIKIENSPRVIGFPRSTFKFSYYSDVIILYFKKRYLSLIPIKYVEYILSFHSSDRTKKLLYADIIIRADKNGTDSYQFDACLSVSRMLGRFDLSSTWAPFIGATQSDIDKIDFARRCISKWMTRRTISIFFEKYVQDNSRKTFWLNYVNYILNFRIVGSFFIKRKLCEDMSLNEFVAEHYTTTNSATSQTIALILYIKDKVFVEFSDVGALYIYDKDNTYIRRRYIEKTDDLKDTSLPLAIEQDSQTYYSYYQYEEEGKINHRGDWQTRLRKWMSHYEILTTD